MENQYVQAAHAPALPADWTRSKADVEADLSGQIDAQERRNETLANEIQAEGQAQAKALRAMIEPMREQVMAERIKYTRDNFGQGINFR
ncbi:MAG: hypothetical protein LBS12_01435, partial [Prevotellaceae bacterium]|nr:hypothetical protein [Prevotellaceae bacterium]